MTAQRRHQGLSAGLHAARPPVTGHKQAGYVSTDGVYVDYDDGGAWYTFMSLAPTVPPPPDPTPDPPPWSAPTPAYFVDTDYETETSAFFDSGFGVTASFSTANPHHGTRHFRDTIVGTSHASAKKVPGAGGGSGVRQLVFREWFSVSTSPSTLQYLMVFNGAAIVFRLALSTSRQVSARIGSASVAVGSPVSAGTYHSVDGVCDISDTTASFTARVDGGTSANITQAGITPSDFTLWQYDQAGTNTMIIDHDQLRMHNTASFYPLADA